MNYFLGKGVEKVRAAEIFRKNDTSEVNANPRDRDSPGDNDDYEKQIVQVVE